MAEAGSDRAAKKVYWWLYPVRVYILSMKTRLSLKLDFGDVDEWINVSLTRWTVSLIFLYVDQMFLFVDRYS